LKKGSWIVAYDRNKGYSQADSLVKQLMQCCKTLQSLVEDPVWFELDREEDFGQFQKMLGDYVENYGEPLIAVIVLRSQRFYPNYKNICYSYNVVSQVVNMRTIQKQSLSVASNILR